MTTTTTTTAKKSPATMTTEEVAAELQVSPRHVCRLLLAGTIPQPFMVGRRRRWRRAEFLNWLLKQGGPDEG